MAFSNPKDSQLVPPLVSLDRLSRSFLVLHASAAVHPRSTRSHALWLRARPCFLLPRRHHNPIRRDSSASESYYLSSSPSKKKSRRSWLPACASCAVSRLNKRQASQSPGIAYFFAVCAPTCARSTSAYAGFGRSRAR